MFKWVMHVGPCACNDLKTESRISLRDEIVQSCVIKLCNWFADIIIKALKKMTPSLLFFFFFSSIPSISYSLLHAGKNGVRRSLAKNAS